MIAQTCWACGLFSIRTSIIFLYLRLFYGDAKFRTACYVMLVVNMLWSVGYICVTWLICLPAASNWDASIKAHCGNLKAAYLVVHVSDLLVDLLVAALPAKVLWRLQMPTGKKIGIMVMLALAAL